MKNGRILGLPSSVVVYYAIAFCAALAVYSWLWKATPEQKGGDYRTYAAVAKDLQGLSLTKVHLRPPGYPLLLLVTGSTEHPSRALFYAQAGLHFATICMLASMLSRAGLGSASLRLFATILLLPPFMEPAAYALTETLTGFLLALGVAASVFALADRKIGLALVAGLSFGYCGATHPTFWLVAAAVATCAWGLSTASQAASLSRHKLVLLTASLLLGSICTLGGLVLQNGVRFGYWRPTPFTGFALSLKTVKVVERLPNEFAQIRGPLLEARNAALIKENSAHTAGSYIWGAQEELERVTGLETKDLSELLVRANLYLIKKAAVNYFSEVIHAAVELWFPSCGPRAIFGLAALQGLWFVVQGAIVAAFWIQLPLVLTMAWLQRLGRLKTAGLDGPAQEEKATVFRIWLYFLSLAIVGYTTVIVAFFGSAEPRMRRPIEALILVSVLLGWTIVRDVLSTGRLRVPAPG